MFFSLLLHEFDHIEPDLHLFHSALVDFPAFEDFLGNFNTIFHSSESFFVLIARIIFDFAYHILFFFICFFIDGSKVVNFVFSDGSFEAFHPLFAYALMIPLLHISLKSNQ